MQIFHFYQVLRSHIIGNNIILYRYVDIFERMLGDSKIMSKSLRAVDFKIVNQKFQGIIESRNCYLAE